MEVTITSPEVLRVVALGGADPSGGAGIARDASMLASIGVTPILIPTALTVQDRDGVAEIEPVSPEVIARSLAVALDAGANAVKLGMLHRRDVVEAISSVLARTRVPVVLDPVLRASSGGALAEDDLIPALKTLMPLVTVITPNHAEADALVGNSGASGQDLVDLGWAAVLLTGGDQDGQEAIDQLVTADWTRELIAPRVSGQSPRGTGCALASLIAAALAGGDDLEQGCRRAKGQLHDRIRRSRDGLLAIRDPEVWPHAAHPFE